MSVVGKLMQGKQNTGGNSPRVVLGIAHAGGDVVGHLEAYAVDIVGKSIRVAVNLLKSVAAIFLIDFCGVG